MIYVYTGLETFHTSEREGYMTRTVDCSVVANKFASDTDVKEVGSRMHDAQGVKIMRQKKRTKSRTCRLCCLKTNPTVGIG